MLINRRIIVSLILTLLIGKNLGTGSERRHKKVDSLLVKEEERKEIEKSKSLDSIGGKDKESPPAAGTFQSGQRNIDDNEESQGNAETQLAPSLLQKWEKAPSLIPQKRQSAQPSLLQQEQQGQLAPSLLQQGQLVQSLLPQKRQLASSLLQQQQLTQSLLQQDQLAPSLLQQEQEQLASSLLQQQQLTQSLLQQDQLAQSLLQQEQEQLAPSFPQRGRTAPSLLQQDQLAPSLLYRKKTARSLLQQQQLSPSLLQQGQLTQSLLQQDQLAPSLLQQGQLAPSLLQQGQLTPSLLQQGQLAPSLLQQGQLAPSLLQQGQLTQSLLQQDQLAPSLLQKRQLAPSLLQQGQLAPSLLQQGQLTQSLLQQDQLAPSLLQKRQLAPSLLQQGQLAPSLLQQGQLTQSLLQQEQLAPSLLHREKTAPSLLQQQQLAPSLLSPTEFNGSERSDSGDIGKIVRNFTKKQQMKQRAKGNQIKEESERTEDSGDIGKIVRSSIKKQKIKGEKQSIFAEQSKLMFATAHGYEQEKSMFPPGTHSHAGEPMFTSHQLPDIYSLQEGVGESEPSIPLPSGLDPIRDKAEYVVSKRNKRQLLHMDFLYTSVNVNKQTEYWLCQHQKKMGIECPGRANVKNAIVTIRKKHNHKPNAIVLCERLQPEIQLLTKGGIPEEYDDIVSKPVQSMLSDYHHSGTAPLTSGTDPIRDKAIYIEPDDNATLVQHMGFEYYNTGSNRGNEYMRCVHLTSKYKLKCPGKAHLKDEMVKITHKHNHIAGGTVLFDILQPEIDLTTSGTDPIRDRVNYVKSSKAKKPHLLHMDFKYISDGTNKSGDTEYWRCPHGKTRGEFTCPGRARVTDGIVVIMQKHVHKAGETVECIVAQPEIPLPIKTRDNKGRPSLLKKDEELDKNYPEEHKSMFGTSQLAQSMLETTQLAQSLLETTQYSNLPSGTDPNRDKAIYVEGTTKKDKRQLLHMNFKYYVNGFNENTKTEYVVCPFGKINLKCGGRANVKDGIVTIVKKHNHRAGQKIKCDIPQPEIPLEIEVDSPLPESYSQPKRGKLKSMLKTSKQPEIPSVDFPMSEYPEENVHDSTFSLQKGLPSGKDPERDQVKYVKGNTKAPQLSHMDFRYIFDHFNEKGDKEYWHCANLYLKNGLNCQGRAIVKDGLVSISRKHNHRARETVECSTPQPEIPLWDKWTGTREQDDQEANIEEQLPVKSIFPGKETQEVGHGISKPEGMPNLKALFLQPNVWEMVMSLLQDDQNLPVGEDNIKIKAVYMATLADGLWLNDDVINGYFHLLLQGRQDLVYLNTFNTVAYMTWSRLYDFWLNRINLARIGLIFVPAHLNGNHWALTVLNFHEKTILMFDSMRLPLNPVDSALNPMQVTKGHFVLKMFTLIKDIYEAKGMNLPIEWSYYENINIPQQENTIDCGIFMLAYVRYMVKGFTQMNFAQQHIPYFRRLICSEMMDTAIHSAGPSQHAMPHLTGRITSSPTSSMNVSEWVRTYNEKMGGSIGLKTTTDSIDTSEWVNRNNEMADSALSKGVESSKMAQSKFRKTEQYHHPYTSYAAIGSSAARLSDLHIGVQQTNQPSTTMFESRMIVSPAKEHHKNKSDDAKSSH